MPTKIWFDGKLRGSFQYYTDTMRLKIFAYEIFRRKGLLELRIADCGFKLAPPPSAIYLMRRGNSPINFFSSPSRSP